MQLIRSIFFYFIMYSFLGWMIEGFFNLSTKGHFIKPNFLLLPVKPMYGIAATLLILIKDVIKKVDLDNEKIIVHLIPGLI